jgi:hypothetical protein
LPASNALASDPFPEAMKTQLNLPEAPLCTVCHLTLIGGIMTVTKPFGRNLQQKYGLILLDMQGLRSAIMQAQANGDDSDGDGAGDIAELIRGTDPNVAEGDAAPEEVRHGCYCSLPPTRSASSAAGLAWLSSLAVIIGRRRAMRRLRSERKQ